MHTLYCVRHAGSGEYLCENLTGALRYIARQLNKPMCLVECREALAAGWDIVRR